MINAASLLAGACLLMAQFCQTARTDASQQPEPFVRADSQGIYLVDGAETRLADAGEFRPFKLNRAAGCLVLSSLDAELQVDSWVLADDQPAADALELRGLLPINLGERHLAFASLPDPYAAQLPRLVVVNSEAQIVLDSSTASLLGPYCGDVDAGEFCILGWQQLNPDSGFLDAPWIAVHSCSDGAELIRWQPELPSALADLELLYQDEQQLLLLLMYDIYTWQILRFDRLDGSSQAVYDLPGQPMYDTLFPGRSSALSHCEMADGLLELDVIRFEGGPLRLKIDPASNEAAAGSSIDSFPRNHNLPMNPADKSVNHYHLEQSLLPLTIDGAWHTPAILDSDGNLLMLAADGPYWLSIK